ncbi:MAG: hypothetical protein LBR39_00755 [Coriobacteriales bacterium]|nr:hypothetical protein [Coriobacteriales bacterium]
MDMQQSKSGTSGKQPPQPDGPATAATAAAKAAKAAKAGFSYNEPGLSSSNLAYQDDDWQEGIYLPDYYYDEVIGFDADFADELDDEDDMPLLYRRCVAPKEAPGDSNSAEPGGRPGAV